MPSLVEGVTQPVHTMLIAGFGTNIFDNMDLEALAKTAARENRWEFMLTAGPIPSRRDRVAAQPDCGLLSIRRGPGGDSHAKRGAEVGGTAG